MIFSWFIARYLFGYSAINDYNDDKFTAMKVLGSFFIGSVDNKNLKENETINISKQPYKYLDE
jgi:hypothetical protein